MGVYGLWRLIDASGKPVPLETLEGKVLAIDISIWMYQVLQGYQDRHGAPRPNAHLLGLFVRICKLLYYRIKPVFVFDGGVPVLKKNTIALRRKQKSIASSKAQKMKTDLINNLIKHSVVKTVLNKDPGTDQNGGATKIMINLQTKRADEDMFVLPDMSSASNAQTYISDDECDSDASVELSPRKQSKWMGNIHSVDVTSNEFKALPADVRYDILTDLKETRKQNSWGRLHEMPQESQDFSGFQLKRLLKRRYVQESLESAEKEMGGKTLTLEELEKLLIEQGVNTKGRDTAFRIAADSTTRLIYISDKNALAKSSADNKSETDEDEISQTDKDEIAQNDTDEILQDDVVLRDAEVTQNANKEIEPVAGPSKSPPIVEDMNAYSLNDESDDDAYVSIRNASSSISDNLNEYTFESDLESENDANESLALLAKKYLGKSKTNPALTYMLEYSGLSQRQIVDLIKHNKNENCNTASKSAKKPEKNDRFENLTESVNSTDEKPKLNCEKTPKSVRIAQEAHVADTNVELIPSSPESSNFVESDPTRKDRESCVTVASTSVSSDSGIILEKQSPVTKSNDVTRIDTSDSDSDDFIEIQDVPLPIVNMSRNIARKNIEITFKTDEKIEDDMFADVFEKADKNEVGPANRVEQTQSSVSTNVDHHQAQVIIGTNVHHQAQVISENNDIVKSNVLYTIPEESIEEETKTETRENIQPTENNTSTDGNKVHDSQSSNETIEQNDIDFLPQVSPVNERTREKSPVLPTNEEDLIELKEQLEDEQEELARSLGKFERQATNISDQIRNEAQELLRLFGIPYVVAPMEAEAQCAYLEQIKLTDGTITDDSDIWLFGGECVYKNFFNNNKRVMQFRACDIQHHFKLTRNQLIQLALLIGSDYTIGVPGIGPVTALEILAAFPAEGENVLHGLHSFSSWIKKGKIAAPGKTGLRNKLRNVKLNRDFPSQAVVQAYLFPTVDESKDTFTWGKPNVVLLCDYTRQKFGWTKGKFDDTMIPVLRRMEENRNQKLLDMYFKAKTSPRSIEPTLSKRVQKALRKLHGGHVDDENADDKPRSKKRKTSDKDIDKEETAAKSVTLIDESKKVNDTETVIDMSNLPVKTSTALDKPVVQQIYTKEYIPQREKSKACALEKKLHAIEVFRKSKQGLGKTKKVKRTVRKIKKEAELSESDSD
ncbi:DNA repair protein complementing XP-G cells [Pseudomyrmex gracilis]|uniref:DNA repair protein complementing XP-G cells n=1 Tax=Pseudomyrmex gracilis TaxID=219809 RepID=UPI000994DB27|nr:DNA repair protein complementing XP-G cells [Pseudomyrmex gracilis]XP_020286690.1 DNA repair protein complementing XP-G cells [Pseudomyrmex gracilis]XP_020286691.1 DNA repair protein complementing XP-G cells [Pseudomyrmex gracilis]